MLNRYAQNAEWSFIWNVLSHYDLPDLSAALAAAKLPQLIYAPLDALDEALNESAAAEAFEFAVQTSQAKGGVFQVVAAGTQPMGEAVLGFLRGLR